MNIYEKIQTIKEDLLKADIKKSGKNNFAGFTYFELADILPAIVSLCNKYKVCTYISFSQELATLTAINTEKTDEKIEISSPMEKLELKGCNSIQALGGVETYSRRYLYLALFDIVEADSFDAVSGKDTPKQATISKATPQQIKQIQELKVHTEKPLSELTYTEAKEIIANVTKIKTTFAKKSMAVEI